MNFYCNIFTENRDDISNVCNKDSYDIQVENACLSAAVLKFLRIPTDGMKSFYW